MDSKGKTQLIKTFSYAIHGIIHGLRNEKNFRIHILAAILAIFFSVILDISLIEWLFIIISIFGVFTLELVNSAIERVVDLATSDFHPLAKQAKDLAAGAVLVYSLMSVVIACVIFIPKLTQFF